MTNLRVLIVDDHPLMREALRSAVEIEEGMTVVGEAVNGKQALSLAIELKPDVVVMDLSMPVMDGIAATSELIKRDPHLKILVVTSSNEDEKVLDAIRAGALGYILKDTPREKVMEGIREVAAGKRYIPLEIAEKLANALNFQEQTVMLTAREREIFNLLGEGLSNKEIAGKLIISETTVRVHISNIVDKLKLYSRREVVLLAKQKKYPEM